VLAGALQQLLRPTASAFASGAESGIEPLCALTCYHRCSRVRLVLALWSATAEESIAFGYNVTQHRRRPPISAIRPRGCTTSITKGKERHNDILCGTGPAGARVFDGAGISSIIGRPVGAPVGLRVLGAVVDGAVDESGSSADGSAEVGAGDGR
jgi:hypothetical protein